MKDNSVLGMIDDLGEKLGEPPIERPQRITVPIAKLSADVWPPEVLEEIRRIQSGEIE